MDGMCQECGKRPGRLVIDPYEQEINNQAIPVVLCEQCEQEAIDDV